MIRKHTDIINDQKAEIISLKDKQAKICLLVEEYLAATGGNQDAIILSVEITKIIESK